MQLTTNEKRRVVSQPMRTRYRTPGQEIWRFQVQLEAGGGVPETSRSLVQVFYRAVQWVKV